MILWPGEQSLQIQSSSRDYVCKVINSQHAQTILKREPARRESKEILQEGTLRELIAIEEPEIIAEPTIQ